MTASAELVDGNGISNDNDDNAVERDLRTLPSRTVKGTIRGYSLQATSHAIVGELTDFAPVPVSTADVDEWCMNAWHAFAATEAPKGAKGIRSGVRVKAIIWAALGRTCYEGDGGEWLPIPVANDDNDAHDWAKLHIPLQNAVEDRGVHDMTGANVPQLILDSDGAQLIVPNGTAPRPGIRKRVAQRIINVVRIGGLTKGKRGTSRLQGVRSVRWPNAKQLKGHLFMAVVDYNKVEDSVGNVTWTPVIEECISPAGLGRMIKLLGIASVVTNADKCQLLSEPSHKVGTDTFARLADAACIARGVEPSSGAMTEWDLEDATLMYKQRDNVCSPERVARALRRADMRNDMINAGLADEATK